MKSKLRGAIANLALLACSSAVAVLLAEFGVRLLAPQPAVRYRYSRDTFYEPIPDARFVYRRSEFAVPVEYNSYGMRDRERRLSKPLGTVRVALVGDSQTESKEVPFDSTFGQILERRLQEIRPERRLEVLNFGVSGFGTLASAARFRALGARFDPDVVLYLFIDNDPNDNCGIDRRLCIEREGKLEFRRLPPPSLRRRTLDVIKHHLQLYAFVKLRLIRTAPSTAAAASPAGVVRGAAPTAASTECWRWTRMAIADLRDRAAACGAPLLVVRGGTQGEEMTRTLHGICAELGVPYHDLLPVLRHLPGPLHFRDDGHWRGTSHAAVADDLMDFVAPFVQRVVADEHPKPANAAAMRDPGVRNP